MVAAFRRPAALYFIDPLLLCSLSCAPPTVWIGLAKLPPLDGESQGTHLHTSSDSRYCVLRFL